MAAVDATAAAVRPSPVITEIRDQPQEGQDRPTRALNANATPTDQSEGGKRRRAYHHEHPTA